MKISIELTTFSCSVRARPGKCHNCRGAPVIALLHTRIDKLWQINGIPPTNANTMLLQCSSGDKQPGSLFLSNNFVFNLFPTKTLLYMNMDIKMTESRCSKKKKIVLQNWNSELHCLKKKE